MIDGEINYRRFLGGDEQGFVELLRDYKDGLLMYINGITGDILLAEECMEETFFKLLTKKPQFSGKSTFKTWLYAIGRNTTVDELRKKRKDPVLYMDNIHDLSIEQDLEREFLKEEERISLHRAMRRLSSGYRQVLHLTFFEDFTNDEAAEIMQMSKRQIENLLYRAKISLKKELEKEDFEYENV